MKRMARMLVAGVLLGVLLVAVGCGFDEDDINIEASSAALVGTTLSWNVLVESDSNKDADLILWIDILDQNSVVVYSSPHHLENLDAFDSETFSYVETGVVLPAGTTSFRYSFNVEASED
jgi:hypothetical protein